MIRAIGTSILFVLFMTAGWGSLDFFQDLPRLLLSFGLLVVPFFFPDGEGSGIRRGREQGESGIGFFVVILLSTIGVTFLIPFLAGHQLGVILFSDSLRYFGVLLCISGYVIRLIAVRTLKHQFSYYVAVQENHQLITTGIYSRIRHPIYLGAILIVAGMSLVFPTWYGFLFVMIYSMVLTSRMKREERLLLKHFGTVYQEYSLKSFRLVPHIY